MPNTRIECKMKDAYSYTILVACVIQAVTSTLIASTQAVDMQPLVRKYRERPQSPYFRVLVCEGPRGRTVVSVRSWGAVPENWNCDLVLLNKCNLREVQAVVFRSVNKPSTVASGQRIPHVREPAWGV